MLGSLDNLPVGSEEALRLRKEELPKFPGLDVLLWPE